MSIAHKSTHGQELSNIGSGSGRIEGGSRKSCGSRQPIRRELRRKAIGRTPKKTGIPEKVSRLVELGLKSK
jgi:ribosomal protein S8E